MSEFQWELPCNPSDLVYFRRRIWETGVALILAATARLHGKRSQESEVVVDTTVQEKNITYPVDTKLYRKIIVRCWREADRQGLKLRRRYGKGVPRWVKDPRKRKLAHKAQRKLRTLASRLVRELERKLPTEALAAQRENFALYRCVLGQRPPDRAKIYSMHEPHIYCIAKGKEHKKYEFGTKASAVMTKASCVIMAAVAHPENIYNGHTLPEVLRLPEAVQGRRAVKAIVERGYRGRRWVEGTEVLTPNRPLASQSKAQSARMRARFRRRSAIEPVISHLKHQYRLLRSFLKGFAGDRLNLMLAASAWNLRKWMRELGCFWLRFLQLFYSPLLPPLLLKCE
ncbi:IS5 family transposase [soil metagenome]